MFYGHINNVAYYAYFDSVVNRFLIEEGGLRPGVDTVVGYVVHSSADYFSPCQLSRDADAGAQSTPHWREVDTLGSRRVCIRCGTKLCHGYVYPRLC
jgi:acyl-CoA thioesterase FadM